MSSRDMEPVSMGESLVEKMPYAVPLMGPLSPISRDPQLRQMAEYLILASGKMSTESAPFAVAAVTLKLYRGRKLYRPTSSVVYILTTCPATDDAMQKTSVESHSICVGTSPVKWVDRCFNTSGQFVRKSEISVADGCTPTDPLLWNVPPGSLEGLPKQELEQRLRSHMINVVVLFQQLDASRGQKSTPAGPPPSQLRDVLVQTDHTELNQTSTYRDLYMTALGRIQELEMDQSSLQSLIQAVEETKITAGTLSADTDTAISTMRQMEQAVREDRCGLLAQMGAEFDGALDD
ncbi:unnamed protein product [Boreogadus saida]